MRLTVRWSRNRSFLEWSVRHTNGATVYCNGYDTTGTFVEADNVDPLYGIRIGGDDGNGQPYKYMDIAR